MGKPFSFRHRFFSRFHDVIISKIGRGCLVGAALRSGRILVGAALRAVRAQRTPRRGIPTTRPHTHKYGRGAIGFSFAPLPQLSHAPDFSFPAAPAAAVTPEACPYHANPSVGAARHSLRSAWLATNREPRLRGGYLRADRTQRTPRRGVPTTRPPYTTNTASGRGGTPCRPHTHTKNSFL